LTITSRYAPWLCSTTLTKLSPLLSKYLTAIVLTHLFLLTFLFLATFPSHYFTFDSVSLLLLTQYDTAHSVIHFHDH